MWKYLLLSCFSFLFIHHHWSLVVVSNVKERLVFYDSLLGDGTVHNNLIEEFLQECAMENDYEALDPCNWIGFCPKNLERILESLQSAEREADDEGDWSVMGELENATAIKAASSDESAASNAYSIERLNRVRDQIVPLARERCEGLRQAVARCDYFEQALCNCQSWCSHMHHILNLRISSDIHALDVPHEYKQMDKEFAEYDNLIKELDEFIETSKSQWSSSERLRLQSEHAKTQLRELRVKYNEFKQPVMLGERMERLSRSLGDIECSIDDLVGIQAENCEYCLIHAKQLHRQLAEELAGDCGALESAKEALMREGIINETQATEISQRISDLQEKCSQLEQRAALSIDKLERCVILLSKLEKEHQEVEKLTQQVEEALVEAIASAKSIPSTPTTPAAHLREKGTAAVTTDTLSILRKQLKAAVEAADKSKELENLLKQNSIRLSPAHCEKIASRDLRISTLKKQLSIWAETIQTSGSEEDSEKVDITAQLTKFEEIAHELCSKLEAITAIPDLDGAELNKKMEKLRPLKDKFDTKALKLVGQHSYENPIEDEELRRKVTQEVGQVAALWHKITSAQPLVPEEEDPISWKSAKSSPHTIIPEDTQIGEPVSQHLTPRATLPRLDSHDLPFPMTNEASEGISASLAANARSLLTDFRNAKQYLDFNQFPVTNLQEWESRLKDLNGWVGENKSKLDELLAIGKKVAESGRMELETHDALARLDDLIEIVHKIDSELEEQEQHLQATLFKRQTFLDGLFQTKKFLQGLSTQLDALKEVDEGRPAINSLVPIIQPIQQDLMEACSQLRVLQLAADELHKALPGYSSHLQNLSSSQNANICPSPSSLSPEEAEAMDQLNAQLREIEGRVQEALVKALQAQEAMSLSQGEEQPVRSSKQTAPDTTSVHSQSSGAGLSLAMDVQDTEGEDESRKQDSEVLKTTVSVRPVRRLQMAEGEEYTLEQFYVNLDTIEEHLEQQEHLPFEGIEEKLEILQDFEVELDRGEQLIQAKQMTMDLAESEHFLQKVAALQQQLANKRRTLEQRRGALTGLDAIFEQCEASIAGLGFRWKQQMLKPSDSHTLQAPQTPPNSSHPLDSNGRNRSPDLDELEASQLELEDQLPPLAVNLQQCSNRLATCIDQLSTATKDRLQSKLQQMTMDFNEYSKEIRERRKHLEERLADQTHLLNQLEMLEFWCDETEANITGLPSILDLEQLDYHWQMVLEKFNEMPEKLEAMRLLDNLKDRFVALATVEPDVKHEIRRNVTQLAKRISDLKLEVNSKFKEVDDQKLACQQFWTEVQQLEAWLKQALEQLTVVHQAKIYRPSMVNIEKLAVEAEENRTTTLLPIQTRLEQEVNKLDNQLNANEKCSHERVLELVKQFDMVCDQFNRVLQENALLSSDSDLEEELEDVYTKMDATKARLLQAQEEAIPNGHSPKQPENGNGSISQSTEYGTLSNSQAPGMEEQLTAEEYRSERQQNHKNTDYFAGHQMDKDDDYDDKRHPKRKMSVGEQGRLDTVTRLRSLLQEIERDISITVDLADQNIVRQAISKAQNWIDELNIDQIEVLRIVDEAKDKLVIERAQLARQGMDKILVVCQRRKLELQHILEQCRSWEQLRGQIELWLTDANEKVTGGGKVNELNDSALKDQLQLITYLHDQAEIWKEQMKSFNDRSNELLDVYRRDDGHNLSHLASKLNTQWTKFNDSLRIRRAVLEAAQRSRSDFHSALGQFQQWLMAESSQMARLERATDNVQRLKDTSKRKDWMAEEKEARAEIDAHHSVMDSIRQMGRKLVEDQEEGRDRAQLKERMDNVEEEWNRLVHNAKTVRERLENAQEECEKLTQNLADLLFWTDQHLKTIANAQPVAGDLGAVQKQNEVIKTIEKAVEDRDNQVKECIQLAHSYLMQHDLRPAMHVPSVLEPPPTVDDGALTTTEAEREERRLGVQILADSDKLQALWGVLKQQVDAWSKVVESAHKDMQELDKCIAESLLAIGSIEDEITTLRLVESLRLEELKDARVENADLRRRTHEASTRIDDVNDWAGQLAAKNIGLSSQLNAQLQAINQRYEKLKKDVGCRAAALERAFNDFGPSSEHFLVDSVEPPWQRSISSVNHLPYYIDHNTENTQWDHPAMVDILEQLATFNQVKFSAYRTAMKLRALQKRLCLDLIELVELDESLERLDKDYSTASEERLRVEDAVMCLVPLFELANERFPHLLKNVPLAVDLALNLLLNIYDPCRDGRLRVLSFKIALVVMCNASLESKYKYLFHLVSTPEGVDHKRLALLFYDLIYIPKFLGEAAAFGGSNIEPSVRSCFEHSKFPPHIFVDDFLDWLKKEPQSIVWLPVMHRLASSEFAKHQAKCNACKMFPIVGMRYRCLRCFNFDICQNCFFSQRIAKNHKLSHPMQEYCLPTNPKDDMRDFTAMVRNKVKRARSKIGYLPVEQVDEGVPLEQTETTPQNPASETMHQRMHMFAQRLEKRQVEACNAGAEHKNFIKSVSMAALPSDRAEEIEGKVVLAADEEEEESSQQLENGPHQHDRQKSDGAKSDGAGVKSPSQLTTQVDQMRKEELDQLLQKLQFENMYVKI